MQVKIKPNNFRQVPSSHKLFKGTVSGVIYLKINETQFINISPLPGSEILFRNYDTNSISVEPFFGTVELTEE